MSCGQMLVDLLKKNYKLTDQELSDMWFDWFCNEKSLVYRGKRMLSYLKKLINTKSEKLLSLHYAHVVFKNNCPVCGGLYDDIRICDPEGDVIYTIIPHSGHRADFNASEVWGRENQFEEPLVKGSWEDVIAYFKAQKSEA